MSKPTTTTTRACDECGTTAASVARIGAVALCVPCLMAAGSVPAYEKAICYDPATRKFQMFLDGEPVGLALTYSDAEHTLDELIDELLHGDDEPARTNDAEDRYNRGGW